MKEYLVVLAALLIVVQARAVKIINGVDEPITVTLSFVYKHAPEKDEIVFPCQPKIELDDEVKEWECKLIKFPAKDNVKTLKNLTQEEKDRARKTEGPFLDVFMSDTIAKVDKIIGRPIARRGTYEISKKDEKGEQKLYVVLEVTKP